MQVDEIATTTQLDPQQNQPELNSIDVNNHINQNKIPNVSPATSSSPQQQQQQQQDAALQNTTTSKNIEKAVKFWTHPSLGNVSSEEKLQYLRHRIGLTDADVHSVWDRLLEQQQDISNNENHQHHPTTISPLATATQPPPLPLHHDVPPPPPPKSFHGGWNQPQQPAPIQNSSSFMAGAPTNLAPQSSSSWPASHAAYYSSTPPATPYFPNHQGVDYGNSGSSPAMIPLMLTIGGFLGVAAAAAMRWLNGGDFCLFPPPQLSLNPIEQENQEQLQQQQQQQVEIEENGDEFIPDITREDRASKYLEEENAGFDSSYERRNGMTRNETIRPNELWMAKQVQSLTQTLETHVRFQERLLQKLASDTTDRSMSLLSTKNNLNDANASVVVDANENIKIWFMMLWAKLVEIRAEISNLNSKVVPGSGSHQLHGSNGDDDLARRLKGALDQLESCMNEIGALGNVGQFNDVSQPLTNAQRDETGRGLGHSVNESTERLALKQHSVDDEEDPCENSSLLHLPPMRDVIRKLAEDNEPSELRVGAQLLYLYVIHLLSHPHVPRYRKIFTTNESFLKVQKLNGSFDLLRAVGFVQGDNYWEWSSETIALHEDNQPTNYKELLLERLRQAAAALSILKSPAQAHRDDSSPKERAAAALAVLNSETAAASMDTGDKVSSFAASSSSSPSSPYTPTPFRSTLPSSMTRFSQADSHSPKRGSQTVMESPLMFQTPQSGNNNIISPPTTKKQPFLSPEEFTSEPSRPSPIVMQDATDTQPSFFNVGISDVQSTSVKNSNNSQQLPSIVDDSMEEESLTTTNGDQSIPLSPTDTENQAVVTDDSSTGKRLLFDMNHDAEAAATANHDDLS